MQALHWQTREPPLAVAGILASGQTIAAVARRLLERKSNWAELRLAVCERHLLVTGESETLPWVGGVTWLGYDGPILCPTMLQPSQPPDLLARAVNQTGKKRLVVATPNVVFVSSFPSRPPSVDQVRSLSNKQSVVS